MSCIRFREKSRSVDDILAIGAVVLLYHNRKKDWKSDISHNLHVRKGLIIDFDRGRPAD